MLGSVALSTFNSAFDVHSSEIFPLKILIQGEKCNEILTIAQGLSEPQPSLEAAQSLGELQSEANCILGACLCLRTVSYISHVGSEVHSIPV